MSNKNFKTNLLFSIAEDGDGGYKLEASYADSENRNSCSHVETDNLKDALETCVSEILEDLFIQEKLNKEKEKEKIQEQIADYKKEIHQLQQRIQEIQQNISALKAKNDIQHTEKTEAENYDELLAAIKLLKYPF